MKELVLAGGDVSAEDRLAAILAQHTTVKHVYLEMPCGPEMAAAMLARNFGNRPQRRTRIQSIATDMEAGRFMEKQPHPVCFDINGVLRDGQHRLAAIILSGCTVWLTICFGCDPAERDYYDQGVPRSVSDISREHGQQNAKSASALVALILRIEQESNETFSRNQQTERLDRLFAEDPNVDAAIKAGWRLHELMPAASGSLAYWHIASHTAHKARLEPFLEGVQKGADLKEGSPALRIHNQLLTERKQGSGRESNVNKAGALVLAWNAMIERRKPRYFEWDVGVKLPEVV